MSFYIKNILYRVSARETEIANGRTIIDPDSFSFFDSSPEELTKEEKDLYREENRTDLLKIKKLEQNLCLHFIMNRFFGLSFDKSIFEQFYNEYASLIDEVIHYNPVDQSRPLDVILSDLDRIVPLAVERNLLDTKYEVKKNFEFPDMYNKNAAPFITFSEGTSQKLQQLIIEKAEEDIATLEGAKGNVYQVTEFGTSKIPNPIFWHKFMHMIKEALPEMMRGTKLSFADLSAQPVEEEDDER
jgi:hypothetical protein